MTSPTGGAADVCPSGWTVDGDAAALYLANVGLISRIARRVGLRVRLDAEAVADFVSEVHLRILEQDYEILRKFQGRSSLATYLTAVLTRLALTFRAQRWGRWRPSETAERAGAVAVDLERLILRDGHSFEEACAVIAERHGGTVTRADLERLAGRLPWHPRRRTTDLEAVETAGGTGTTTVELDYPARMERARVERALRFAVASLPEQDRRLLRLRYGGGHTLAEASRVLGVDQKPLYKRVERLHRQLKEALLAGGVSRDAAVCAIRH